MVLVKIFDYRPDISSDTFVATKDYSRIARILHMDHVLATWIGELFALDKSQGVNWFSNWCIQDKLGEELLKRHESPADGEAFNRLLQERYKVRSYKDVVILNLSDNYGKVDDSEFYRRFWIELLDSLHLRLETIFDEARTLNDRAERCAKHYGDPFKPVDLESRISRIKAHYDEHKPAEYNSGKKIKVFRYLPALGAFVLSDEYSSAAMHLHLDEHHEDNKYLNLDFKMFTHYSSTQGSPIMWFCRFLGHGSVLGEHLFDNWQQRGLLASAAKKHEVDTDGLYIVNPDRFADGKDGKPQHSSAQRKRFWTDVFKSLQLSVDLLCDLARTNYEKAEAVLKKRLEDAIARVHREHGGGQNV